MTLFGRKKSTYVDAALDDDYVVDVDEKMTDKIVMIPLDQILPNPSQPRKVFDEVDIVNLADSIRQHGLIQPISVRISSKSNRTGTVYYCVAGERRLRAFKMLGRSHIPCILVATSPSESAEMAIIENIMRKDLNLFEYAGALATLIEKYNFTQEELALKMSTSQSNIANKLRLLRFSPKEQELILQFGLSERHARALLRIGDDSTRLEAVFAVGESGMNVKETEEYVDALFMPTKNDVKQPQSYNGVDFCRMIDRKVSWLKKKGLFAESSVEESDSEFRVTVVIGKN